MWRCASGTFEKIRPELDSISVIDTHEHNTGICPPSQNLDILAQLSGSGYFSSDIISASDDKRKLISYLCDTEISFDERFNAWQKYFERTCHTSYAKGLYEGLKNCWGITCFSKESLLKLQEKMRSERNQDFFDKKYREHGIEAMIVNVNLEGIMRGDIDFNKDLCRFVFPLPAYHNITGINDIRKPHLEDILGKTIISLDDYLEAFEAFLQKCIDFGIIGIKDQSAYYRKIFYGNPSKAKAEEIFNEIISRPRDKFSTEEARDLDDYLFNQFMIMAAKYKLPVQIHTGHMAHNKNEISKANPVHLTSILETHQDVTFDLFHGGWPYMGESLFLGKNYPNVNLDMCWVHTIDPLYSVEFLKRAIMTVPHSKILGFGGDSAFEPQIGYLIQAKDNIAIALSDLIDSGWLDMEAAINIARDILYENPQRVFSL